MGFCGGLGEMLAFAGVVDQNIPGVSRLPGLFAPEAHVLFEPRRYLEIRMLDLALTAVLLVALAGIVFGVRYMRRDAFLPYHAAVAGKSWSELDPGVHIIILGMLKIIGRVFAALCVAFVFL